MVKNNIIIAGEGGQGVQTIAEIFSKACFSSGLQVSYTPSFGVEQRGTPSVAFITTSDKKIHKSRFTEADYIFILQHRAIKKIQSFIGKKTIIIFDCSVISNEDLPENYKAYAIPATKIAIEKFTPRAYNIIMLGVITKLFCINKDLVWEETAARLIKKLTNSKIKKANKEAFSVGFDFSLEEDDFSPADYKTKNSTVIVKNSSKTGRICPKLCKGCGICVLKCPVGALSLDGEFGVFATPIPKIDLEKCIACGNCRLYCPDGAISVDKN